MLKTVSLFLIASAVLISPATASDKHKVGSCPAVITIDNKGSWRSAKLNSAALSNTQKLSSHVLKVSAVYTKSDGSSYNVASIKPLDAHQGNLNKSSFETMRSKLSEMARDKNTDRYIQYRINNNLKSKGKNIVVNGYSFSGSILNRERDFIVLGMTAYTNGGRQLKYLTAQKNILLHNCIISLNFSFPESSTNFDTIIRSVADVSIR